MRRLLLVVTTLGCLAAAGAIGGDWPQFRYDARRGAASPDALPGTLHLQWVRELPAPRPAFPGEARLRYDATYEPVVLGKTMLVPSMVTDSVAALDTETGAERWRFFAEGPVRFAPVAWKDKAYFVSDDGHLYCVDAANGGLLWKHRGLPRGRKDRKVLGDGRLVSLFPARGGPVLADGVVYYGAGLWSAEGVFVHALDAATGRVRWSNTESHRIEKANMDHGVGYFAGLSPHGYLAIVDGKLVVPCGAQLPALLDPATGSPHTYTMGWGGRVGLPKGSWFVAGTGKYLIHSGDLYDIRQENQERFRNRRGRPDFKGRLYLAGRTRLQIDRANQKALGDFRKPVLADKTMFCQDQGIVAWDLTAAAVEERAKSSVPPHRKRDKYPDKVRATFRELWRLPRPSKVHILAGGRLYCGARGAVEAIGLPAAGQAPAVTWRATVQGTPHRMLAADGKLFVVTREGRIYAFGGQERAKPTVHQRPADPPLKADEWTQRAADILKATGTTDGYVVALGIGTGFLVEELVRQSRCRVIVVEADAARAAEQRSRLHRAGLYGTKIAIVVGDPLSYPLPPYLASLVVAEDPAVLGGTSDRVLAGAVFHCLRPYGGTACLPIPPARRDSFARAVAASGLAGATVRQAGDRVVLTRGGALPTSGNWSQRGANAANTGACEDRFLKPPLGLLWFDGSVRWSRRPELAAVRVVGGRLLVGTGALEAVDVFTGRRLWRASLPPAPGSAAGLAAVEDAIYLTRGKSCVAFDPATGRKSAEWRLPADVTRPLSHLRVSGDRLFGISGRLLLCLDRRSGQPLWRVERRRAIGSIALGGGKVFCADFVSRRRGRKPSFEPTTEAFDAATGKRLWQVAGGPEVRYCEPLDLVFTASGVYRGSDGTRVRAGGPARITGDKVLSGNHAGFVVRDLRTGKAAGEPLMWPRRGCTTLRASALILTTRYRGNAATVDLATGRIASLWNIRAACSNNLFPANGVLNVPNLTGGCTCNYLPVSQAFVPVSVLARVGPPAGSARRGAAAADR